MEIKYLKSSLLRTNYFIDNKWLDKYVLLIIGNESTSKEKFVTQKHHIIPKMYYKSIGICIDNSKNNVVNLKRYDHILAHYYLSKCSANTDTYIANILSIKFICNTYQQESVSEKWLLENAPTIQSDYERVSKLSASKLKESSSNRKSIFKDGIYKYVKINNLDDYLLDGWILQSPIEGMVSWNASLPENDERRFKLGHDQHGSNNGNYGKFKYTNGIDYIRCSPGDEPDGYYRTNPKRNAHKKVKCTTTGIIYQTTREASRSTGVTEDHIRKICRGLLNYDKVYHKEVLTWEYV